MVAALIDRLTFRSHVLDMNGDSYRLKATRGAKPDPGGSNIRERVAHFFVDIYTIIPKDSVLLYFAHDADEEEIVVNVTPEKYEVVEYTNNPTYSIQTS